MVEKADGRRVVSLTPAGTAYVAERRVELDAVWESVGRDADSEAGELWELGQLHAAACSRSRPGPAAGRPPSRHLVT